MITIPSGYDGRLRQLMTVFLAENENINLSGHRTEEACWVGNVMDSLGGVEVLRELFTLSPDPFPHGGKGNSVEEEPEYWKKKPVRSDLLEFAREMRKTPTPAENKLRDALRFEQLGIKFRRQHPHLGNIFDFYSHEVKLAIEVDGLHHKEGYQAVLDKDRDKYFFEEFDIYTLRFWNSEVMNDLPSVLQKIREAIQKQQTKQLPSPNGGRDGNGGNSKQQTKQVLDVGTGGGFPLLPLAICFPQIHCTGLDATRKKIDAVRRIADKLELKNIDLLWNRSEKLAEDPAHRKHYDVVTARAVADLSQLLQWSLPFVKHGGHLFFWKSIHIDEELKAAMSICKRLHCLHQKNHLYDLPDPFGKRQIVVFKKM